MTEPTFVAGTPRYGKTRIPDRVRRMVLDPDVVLVVADSKTPEGAALLDVHQFKEDRPVTDQPSTDFVTKVAGGLIMAFSLLVIVIILVHWYWEMRP